MGIKIELTDENLPEIGAEYEISDEEVEILSARILAEESGIAPVKADHPVAL